jgi:hypothetical protein
MINFDELTRHIIASCEVIEPIDEGLRMAITAGLRLAWTVRGAADSAKLEDVLTSRLGAAASDHLLVLDRELRALDRY